MKSLKILAAAGALASAFFALPASAQTASLNYGTNTPVTCTFSGLTLLNGNLDITCTTPATNTNTPVGTGPFTVTVNILPAGSGTIAAPAGVSNWQCGTGVSGTSCTGTVAASTATTFTATAATGYTFSNWQGATCTGGNNTASCATTISSNVTMSANFTSGGTTAPPGVVMIGTPGICGSAVGTMASFNMGTTYSFTLPKTSSGAGQVAISSEGGVGTNAQLEVSFSKVPGDWTTAKATSQTTSGGFGFGGFSQVIYPYYSQQGGYVSLPWQSTGSGAAIILPTETWYVNLRMSNATGYLTVQISSPGCN